MPRRTDLTRNPSPGQLHDVQEDFNNWRGRYDSIQSILTAIRASEGHQWPNGRWTYSGAVRTAVINLERKAIKVDARLTKLAAYLDRWAPDLGNA